MINILPKKKTKLNETVSKKNLSINSVVNKESVFFEIYKGQLS